MESKNDEIFEALLKVAANEALRQEVEAMPGCEELDKLYVPSPEFDKRIRKIISMHENAGRIKRTAKAFGKAAAVIGIFVTVGTTILLSVEASRNFILNTIIKTQKENVSFEFKESGDTATEGNFTLGYIPDGFEYTGGQTSDNMTMTIYADRDGGQIIFQYGGATSASISIDNENKAITVIPVNQLEAYLFEANSVDDYNILMWQSGNSVFKLISSINTDELIRVAENILKK